MTTITGDGFDPSPEQAQMLDVFTKHYRSGARDLRGGGLAGTGKTTVARVVPDAFDVPRNRVAYVAPTGKAARVLSAKLDVRADTVHSLLYLPVEKHCDECPRSTSTSESVRCHDLRCPRCAISWARRDGIDSSIDLIVVDEASMVNSDMYQDLVQLGRPVVFIGDHGQLPPVRSEFNLMAEHELHAKLETVHRQAENSAILRLAMQVRMTGRLPEQPPGAEVEYVPMSAVPINFSTWSRERLVLCATNATRTTLNGYVRQNLGRKNDLDFGDRVICLRNDRKNLVVNGTLGTVRGVVNDGHRSAIPNLDVDIEIDDSPFPYSNRISIDQFKEPSTIQEFPRWIGLWTYGYVITVHKAQGSESDEVILFDEVMPGADRKRWLYTAITRARKKLTIVR